MSGSLCMEEKVIRMSTSWSPTRFHEEVLKLSGQTPGPNGTSRAHAFLAKAGAPLASMLVGEHSREWG